MLTLHNNLSILAEELTTSASERVKQWENDTNGVSEESEKTAAERIQQQRIYTHHPTPPPMVPLNIFRPDISSVEGISDGVSEEEAEEARRLREKADSLRTRKRTQAELESIARSKVRLKDCVLFA
jgi:hypothetical protein